MFFTSIAIVASTILPAFQARRQHMLGMEFLSVSSNAAVEQSQLFHRQGLEQLSNHYKTEYTANTQQFTESMQFSLNFARKETVRDAWLQRNSLIQTFLVICSLMFAAAFENITQATIPKTSSWMVYVHSLVLAAALLALSLSIILCLKIQERLGNYCLHDPSIVYTCGGRHIHFNDYFSCHCGTLKRMVTFLFYVGSLLVLGGSLSLQALKFQVSYRDSTSTILFLVTLAIGAVFLMIAPKVWSSATHRFEKDFAGADGIEDEEMSHQDVRRGNSFQHSSRVDAITASREPSIGFNHPY